MLQMQHLKAHVSVRDMIGNWSLNVFTEGLAQEGGVILSVK